MNKPLLTAAAATLLPMSAALAAPITQSATPPSDDVVAETFSDGNETSGASVRFRDGGDDTDLGSVFTYDGDVPVTLDGVTVQIFQPGSEVDDGDFDVVFDFYAFDSSDSSYTPLFRETGLIPAGVANGDFLTFDVSDQGQTLAPDSQYAFIVGSADEFPDENYNALYRFRLGADQGEGTAENFEIRRDFEFGETRPGLNDTGGIAGNDRELNFSVQASVIPEPATAGLAIAGLGLLGLRRRRA